MGDFQILYSLIKYELKDTIKIIQNTGHILKNYLNIQSYIFSLQKLILLLWERWGSCEVKGDQAGEEKLFSFQKFLRIRGEEMLFDFQIFLESFPSFLRAWGGTIVLSVTPILFLKGLPVLDELRQWAPRRSNCGKTMFSKYFWVLCKEGMIIW